MAKKKSKLEELKKLSPEERIKRLKELQEADKKEIEEAQQLIRESQEQAEHEEELKRQIPIPQLKSIDIESLFTPEEKELFKVKRYVKEKKPEEIKEIKPKEKPLEQTVFEEAPRKLPEEVAELRQYGMELSKQPASALRERAENIYESFKKTGEITYDQKKELDAIGYAEAYKMQEIQAGGYEADKRTAEEMVVTQKIKNWLQDKYRGHSLYKRGY
jgi:hypothetical protein